MQTFKNVKNKYPEEAFLTKVKVATGNIYKEVQK